jgi:hypothetical protein
MRVLPLAAFALAATISAQASAQEQSAELSAREAQKAACQQEANLIYRTSSRGIGMGQEVRSQIIAARRAYVRDCMAKAEPAPG